jgi:hypothetical protein
MLDRVLKNRTANIMIIRICSHASSTNIIAKLISNPLVINRAGNAQNMAAVYAFGALKQLSGVPGTA